MFLGILLEKLEQAVRYFELFLKTFVELFYKKILTLFTKKMQKITNCS